MIALLAASPLTFSAPTLGVARAAPRAAMALVNMGVVEVDDTWTTTSSGLMYKDLVVGDGAGRRVWQLRQGGIHWLD